MEEEKKEVVNGKCPGKLNFNVPLLSTRRTTGINRMEVSNANTLRLSCNTCERIPFSWEQTPGKPKESSDTNENIELTPPKPPPGRWIPTMDAFWDCHGKVDPQQDYDEGCDGDVEDDAYEDCKDYDVSSNALDIFSLAQSVDTVETRDKAWTIGIGNLETEDLQEGIGSHSPNFMIQRFLPDAKALAASSAFALSKDIKNQKFPKSNTCTGSTSTSFSRAISVRQSSYSSSKGCGLDIFFPWRMKPRPCGVKSPVMALAASKPSWSRRK